MPQFNFDDWQTLKSNLLGYLASSDYPSGASDFLEGELTYLIKDTERLAEVMATLEEELSSEVPSEEALCRVMEAIALELFEYVYCNQEYD